MADPIQSVADELPLKDLDPQTRQLAEQVLATRRPLAFTQGGEPAALLVDADAYRERERRLALMGRLARGRRELDEGHGLSQAEVEALLEEWLPDSE
jgi:PHD/YefM family antitoxin component YafN of YafNO toxin-antitoxin module